MCERGGAIHFSHGLIEVFAKFRGCGPGTGYRNGVRPWSFLGIVHFPVNYSQNG
jgi:hypothetical protein